MIVRHVALPALGPAAIVVLYFTPISLLGCVNRGLLALVVLLVTTAFAFAAVAKAFAALARRDPEAQWWIVSALILTLPLALVAGPLG